MSAETSTRPAWFVGAAYNRTEDQTPRFLAEGIWENGYRDGRYGDVVRSMQPGDRIAIKSSYTRKHDLLFDNRGSSVSVMAIKAVGTIMANLDDGKQVKVAWSQISPPREWYFYTSRATVWRVAPGGWMEDALLAFAFEGKLQDTDRFRNAPFWHERFGDAGSKPRFRWAAFYSAFASRLLDYRHDRGRLLSEIHSIPGDIPGMGIYLNDRYTDGKTGPLLDICPFTTMGMFNRSMTDANRHSIAAALGKLMGIEEDAPTSFEGIPVLNNQRSWFFRYGDKRGQYDIDKLWDMFVTAAALVEADMPEQREAFVAAYDAVIEVWGASWNISTGLYWSHPWEFPTLESNSRRFLTERLQMQIPTLGPLKPCSGATYLKLVDDLKARFAEESYPVHNFPELSLASRHYKASEDAQPDSYQTEQAAAKEEEEAVVDPVQVPAPSQPYGIDDILRDGCFLERSEIERLLERLRARKNLILQGPPGTGKTWIAKRLAFALMGERDEARVRAVQFHPNLSYEDFVRGWRPSGDGKLTLADGVFMEAIRAALSQPAAPFVVIIEEINRGSPAQIFGELLTLLEAGKRTPRDALELCYPDSDGVRRPVHVPENLFVIGTMNIADRSLALVDLAFRRRFAFVGLEPRLGPVWRHWVTEKGGVEPALADDIEQRIVALNARIAESFGRQFEIGHSYVTPTAQLEPGTTREWFRQVVETEIGPLLDEYWFDAQKSAREAVAKLLEGW